MVPKHVVTNASDNPSFLQTHLKAQLSFILPDCEVSTKTIDQWKTSTDRRWSTNLLIVCVCERLIWAIKNATVHFIILNGLTDLISDLNWITVVIKTDPTTTMEILRFPHNTKKIRKLKIKNKNPNNYYEQILNWLKHKSPGKHLFQQT